MNDSARLDLKDTLDLAIFLEEDEMERYEVLADRLEGQRTPDGAAFFRYMALNEARHRSSLAARRGALFRGSEVDVTRTMLGLVGLPAKAFTLRDALEISLIGEKRAREFFKAAHERVGDPEMQTLFARIASEETEHERLVQRELDRLPADILG